MEVFAERDIRQMFSEHDGWKVAPVAETQPAGRFYRITRGKWAGVETAFIAVSFDQVPQEDFVGVLDTLADGQGARTKKFLLTPQATDTSFIPPHIRILLMNAFAFSEGRLVWLTKKKNAKQFIPEQTVTA
ncbi:MAG: hypothetical protein WC391_03640 [Methanoregula sp.]